MTFEDYQLYTAYTAKHGPLSVARMHDRPAALLAYMIATAAGARDAKLSDYMPHWHTEDTGEL